MLQVGVLVMVPETVPTTDLRDGDVSPLPKGIYVIRLAALECVVGSIGVPPLYNSAESAPVKPVVQTVK